MYEIARIILLVATHIMLAVICSYYKALKGEIKSQIPWYMFASESAVL